MTTKNKQDDEPTRVIIIGVDSEGYWDTDRLTHVCDMVRIGNVLLGAPGERVLWLDIVEALADIVAYYEAQGVVVVFYGYYLGYDINQWVRGLSNRDLERLADRDGRAVPTKGGKSRSKFRKPSTTFKTVTVGNPTSKYASRLDWFFGKQLRVGWPVDGWKQAAAKRDPALMKWKYTTIYDIGSAFGSAFLKAIESWLAPTLTDDDREVIAHGKATRAINCTREERAEMWDEVAHYNEREVQLLERLVPVAWDALNRVVGGGLPFGIDGPGVVAGKMLSNYAVQGADPQAVEDAVARALEMEESVRAATREAVRTSSHLLEADMVAEMLGRDAYRLVNDAYFGGWFEVHEFGEFGPVWEYDINSAYPHVMRGLPSLKDATCRWLDVDSEGFVSTDDIEALDSTRSLVFVEATVYGDNDKVGPVMWRNDEASVTRPTDARTFVYWPELKASERAGLVKTVDVHRALVIDLKHPGVHPLADVEKAYAERKRLGKNDPTGLALKLVINSLYGKLAQSVGTPRYANAVYAALITAGCRMMILDAIATHPDGTDALVAVATDAVFFDSPHPTIDIDPERLGAWDELKFERAWFLQPGVWGGAETVVSFENLVYDVKTRGVSRGAFVAELYVSILPKMRAMMEAGKWDSSQSVELSESFSMTPLPLAVANGKPWEAGEFSMNADGLPEALRELTFETLPKRDSLAWTGERFTSLAPVAPWSPEGGYTVSATRPDIIGGLVLDWDDEGA